MVINNPTQPLDQRQENDKLEQYISSENNNGKFLKKSKPDIQPLMFQTTRINTQIGTIPNNSNNPQFKFSIPSQPLTVLKHEFSKLKFNNKMEPICTGYPSDVEAEYTDEEFHYDQKKIDLALDNDPIIKKDSIRIKDSLKLLEIYALQNFYKESTIQIDGMEIVERPEITIQNLNRVPAYKEWKNATDLENKKDIQNKENQKTVQQAKLILSKTKPTVIEKDIKKNPREMEFSISNEYVGLKRSFNYQAPIKITGVPQEVGTSDIEEPSQKRAKFNQESTLSKNDQSLTIQQKINEITARKIPIEKLDSSQISQLSKNYFSNDNNISSKTRLSESYLVANIRTIHSTTYQQEHILCDRNTQYSFEELEHNLSLKTKNEEMKLVHIGQDGKEQHEMVYKNSVEKVGISQQFNSSTNQNQQHQQHVMLTQNQQKTVAQIIPQSIQVAAQNQPFITPQHQQMIIEQHTHDDLTETPWTHDQRKQVNYITINQDQTGQIQMIPAGEYSQLESIQAITQPQQQVVYMYQTPYGLMQVPQQHQTHIIGQQGATQMINQQIMPGGTIINPQNHHIQIQPQIQQTPSGQIIITQVPSELNSQGQNQPQIIHVNAQGQPQQIIQAQPQQIQTMTSQGPQTQALIQVGGQPPQAIVAQPQQQQLQLVQTNQGPMYITSQTPVQQVSQNTPQNQTISTQNGQATVIFAHPQAQLQQQPQYQLATTSNGQQVLIQIPQSQSQQQTVHSGSQLQQPEQLTFIQTPQGLVLAQQQPGNQPKQNVQKATQIVNELGQVVQMIPQNSIQTIEHDPLQSSIKLDLQNLNQFLGGSQGQSQIQQQQQTIQLIYDASTGQYLQVQQQQPVSQAIPGTQLQIQHHSQGHAIIHGQQNGINSAAQTVVHRHQQEPQIIQAYIDVPQNQVQIVPQDCSHRQQPQSNFCQGHANLGNRDESPLGPHQHGASSGSPSGMCNHCHKTKGNHPFQQQQNKQQMNNQQRGNNFNQKQKNEHQCQTSQQPQIVYQPFYLLNDNKKNVIKSNIYQTQYNSNNPTSQGADQVQSQIIGQTGPGGQNQIFQEIVPQSQNAGQSFIVQGHHLNQQHTQGNEIYVEDFGGIQVVYEGSTAHNNPPPQRYSERQEGSIQTMNHHQNQHHQHLFGSAREEHHKMQPRTIQSMSTGLNKQTNQRQPLNRHSQQIQMHSLGQQAKHQQEQQQLQNLSLGLSQLHQNRSGGGQHIHQVEESPSVHLQNQNKTYQSSRSSPYHNQSNVYNSTPHSLNTQNPNNLVNQNNLNQSNQSPIGMNQTGFQLGQEGNKRAPGQIVLNNSEISSQANKGVRQTPSNNMMQIPMDFLNKHGLTDTKTGVPPLQQNSDQLFGSFKPQNETQVNSNSPSRYGFPNEHDNHQNNSNQNQNNLNSMIMGQNQSRIGQQQTEQLQNQAQAQQQLQHQQQQQQQQNLLQIQQQQNLQQQTQNHQQQVQQQQPQQIQPNFYQQNSTTQQQQQQAQQIHQQQQQQFQGINSVAQQLQNEHQQLPNQFGQVMIQGGTGASNNISKDNILGQNSQIQQQQINLPNFSHATSSIGGQISLLNSQIQIQNDPELENSLKQLRGNFNFDLFKSKMQTPGQQHAGQNNQYRNQQQKNNQIKDDRQQQQQIVTGHQQQQNSYPPQQTHHFDLAQQQQQIEQQNQMNIQQQHQQHIQQQQQQLLQQQQQQQQLQNQALEQQLAFGGLQTPFS
ncbi:UNKNOWN [Stylonychia lemnae]|uniref:Uncharacterized protein n=1 Tax=Stylonychia lemnae TaxID=5949 RepID=A0A077ZXU4_STYLE|nr:UNKNOWN [Stylonychia lemnae]|eukprot:CDW74407.1 UNKNOWN [Stylonychia lemnae]